MWNSVDTSGLINAINNALNDLNSYSLNEINTLSGTDVLNGSLKKLVVGKLNNIQNSTSITGSIASLRNNLNTLKSGASKIKSWQSLYKEIQNLEENKWIYVPEYEDYYYYNGQIVWYTVPATTELNQEIQNQINSKNSQLNSLESEIISTLNSVN